MTRPGGAASIFSFASAVFQALTAIVIVGIAAVLLNATAKTMGDTVRVVEIVGYAMIMLIGLRLLWVKGRALITLLRPQKQPRTSIITSMSMTTRMRITHAHHACASCARSRPRSPSSR